MKKLKYLKYEYWEIAEKKVCLLTISIPQTLNSLSTPVLEELDYFMEQLEKGQTKVATEIHALVIRGEGDKSFVSGADIAEMSEFDYDDAWSFAELGTSVFSKIENFSTPVIAAVNGYALGGGCEMAMACDIRIASENAKFAQPEVGLGIIPGFFGTYRLPRLIGIGLAKELILTGRVVKANEALQIGLVNQVVAQENLMNAVKEMLEKILANDGFATNQAKRAVNYASNGYEYTEYEEDDDDDDDDYDDDDDDYDDDDDDDDENDDSEIANAEYNEHECFATCFKRKQTKQRMKAFLKKQTEKSTKEKNK